MTQRSRPANAPTRPRLGPAVVGATALAVLACAPVAVAAEPGQRECSQSGDSCRSIALRGDRVVVSEELAELYVTRSRLCLVRPDDVRVCRTVALRLSPRGSYIATATWPATARGSYRTEGFERTLRVVVGRPAAGGRPSGSRACGSVLYGPSRIVLPAVRGVSCTVARVRARDAVAYRVANDFPDRFELGGWQWSFGAFRSLGPGASAAPFKGVRGKNLIVARQQVS
jgi:hypothetical protein